MKSSIVSIALLAASTAAFAAKPCEELKAEITAQLEDKHVVNYSLEIVPNDKVGDRKVVGSCDGGTNKIVYERPAASPPAEPAPDAGAAQKKQ